MLSSGFDSGIVVNIDDNRTTCTAFYQSCRVEHSFTECTSLNNMCLKYSWKAHLGASTGRYPSDTDLIPIEEDIFTVGFVAENYEHEVRRFLDRPGETAKRYEFPDGRTIYIGIEQFRIPEVIFCPARHRQYDAEPLPEVMNRCFNKLDPDLLSEILLGPTCGIALSGNVAKLKGIAPRLKLEIAASLAKRKDTASRVHVVATPVVNEWVGGSILASMEKTLWLLSDGDEDKDVESAEVRNSFIERTIRDWP